MSRNPNPLNPRLKRFFAGSFLSVMIISLFLLLNGSGFLPDMYFYETIPFYLPEKELAEIFRITPEDGETPADMVFSQAAGESPAPRDINIRVYTNRPAASESQSAPPDGIILETIFTGYDTSALIGTEGVAFQTERPEAPAPEPGEPEKLRDFEYLRSYYTVQENTLMTEADFDIDKLLSFDNTLDRRLSGEPQILICHTHSSESYIGGGGVLEAGERLAQALMERYGIVSVHMTSGYDVPEQLGAYERIEPDIARVLREYPSIEIVIDLHRDGVPDGSPKFVTLTNGKPTARIMFVNGLSKLYENGVLIDIPYLPNPNLQANLSFSLNAQLSANRMYPGLTRNIYLKAYRYTLSQRPKSLLVEVGAQNNTIEEALNAAEALADVLADVVLR